MIRYINLAAQFAEERRELMPRIEAALASGMYIGGTEVEALEQALATYCGVRHAIAVNSGTDALMIGMAAVGIGPGDEVITPPNSFVASAAAIVKIGAKPVFADVRRDELIDPAAVEAVITSRTAAIMAVHLRGGVCDMPALRAITQRHGLLLVEDAAQAIGSMLDGVRTGALGDLGCFSAHPLKLLNAAGDGGFVTTNADAVADAIRRVRNHGLLDRNTVMEWGIVSRLDAVQAAILRFRLERLDGTIARRRANAAFHQRALAGLPLTLPRERMGEFHTFNTYTIQLDDRDALQAWLAARGIECPIHYPRPIHLQPAARALGTREGDFPVTERLARTILSLPVHQYLTQAELGTVAAAIADFAKARAPLTPAHEI